MIGTLITAIPAGGGGGEIRDAGRRIGRMKNDRRASQRGAGVAKPECPDPVH
jgi:hypothetical protein